MNLAEKGEVEKAVEIFNEIIKIQPDLSSTYNNRAQAYRLLGNDESKYTKRQELWDIFESRTL